MTPQQFATIGKALHGNTWQTAIASDLAVTDRQVRYYVSGDRPIPAQAAKQLLKLLIERRELLSTLARTIAL